MVNGQRAIDIALREDKREKQFQDVWTEELDDVFSDVADYYDRANHVASLGLWNWFRSKFVASVELKSGQQALDVCAGTNAIGIALSKKQPDLEVTAIDKSPAMQRVGKEQAQKQGVRIKGLIGDAHRLPFPDDYFDVVTLQYASRHLRIFDVCKEVNRVLKPDGHFHHCDMLRPGNKIVEKLYYAYLRLCLEFTSAIFRSGTAAVNCKQYFIATLQMFYSADELSELLRKAGFENVSSKCLLGGMIGIHKARKRVGE